MQHRFSRYPVVIHVIHRPENLTIPEQASAGAVFPRIDVARSLAVPVAWNSSKEHRVHIGTADWLGDKIDPHVRERASHTLPFKVRVLYHQCAITTTCGHGTCRLQVATCRDHTRIHLLAGKHLSQALDSAAEANDSVDARRVCELAGSRVDNGINNDHRRASGEVARPLPVIAAPCSPKICPRLNLDYAWPDLADKASEPSRATSYPLSYISLARSGQKRSRIGANGVMVYRMGVPF